jgi:hypothetical protein
VRADDGPFFIGCRWVAVDSAGRRFGGDTEQEAREMAERYNHFRSRKDRS